MRRIVLFGISVLSVLLMSFILLNNSNKDCSNKYKSKEFKLSICMEPEWNAKISGSYLIISKDKINITIYKSILKNEKSPKDIANEELEEELNNNSFTGLEVVKKEAMKIDGMDAYMITTHLPKIKSETGFQRETTFMTIYYIYKGFVFAINNNCYSENCSENQLMIRKVAELIELK